MNIHHFLDELRSVRAPRQLPFALIFVAVLLLQAGCDQYAEIRAGMTANEVARFDRGKRSATACWSCHDLASRINKIGPHLRALAGRRAGSVEGYPYSLALADASFVWTARTLDAFLADAQGFAPGTRMVSPSLSDSRQRADLVFFLLNATAEPGSSTRAGARSDESVKASSAKAD